MKFFKDLIQFIRELSKDSRIPSRDRKLIAVFLILILSPVDLIPDWIPILGALDDILLLALVLDYLFEVLDTGVLLAHYPWSMKSFQFLKSMSRMITVVAPRALKEIIWKYQKDSTQLPD